MLAEEPTVDVGSSDRRIWKHRDGSQGSLLLSLKAFGVLYDAGRPLTLEEFAQELRRRLVPTEIGYLEAWQLRRRQYSHKANARRRTNGDIQHPVNSCMSSSIDEALPCWLRTVFRQRRKGRTLIQDAEGRYAPGPAPPRIQTIDGELRAYTPTVRHELEQADRNAGRTHLALLEWKKALAAPEFATLEARAELLMFLARTLFVGANHKALLDQRHLRKHFGHLLQLADTLPIKRAILERVVLDLFKE